MTDNKQGRKTLERTTDCDIRIDNTVRYNNGMQLTELRTAADAESVKFTNNYLV